MKKTVLAVLLAGCLCVPVWAEADSAETDTLNATIMNEDVVGNVEAEIEDGILTIRMEASEMGKEGFWWEYLQDEADPHVELLTQSTEEEDLDYAGSFRGLEDGESLIRLVYTNGVYVYQYIEFYVKVENGAITERTGGGYAYPDSAESLAESFGGTWQCAEDENTFMEIELGEDNSLLVTVSDGSGQDGLTSVYTMTVYPDALTGTLVYKNGGSHTVAVTDSEEAAAEDTMEEGSDEGYLMYQAEEGSEELQILWVQGTEADAAGTLFVRAEEE